MKAIDCLLTRNACACLTAPAPSQLQLDTIFKAAFRAPDHARLRPWRFLTISENGLNHFSELFVECLQEKAQKNGLPPLNEEEQAKAYKKGQRAPLVIVVIAQIQDDCAKVPEIEQYLSAGAAAQNISLAIHALGFYSIWRTGTMAYSELVKSKLGLQKNEHIVGFIYTGTANQKLKPIAQLDLADFVTVWS